MLCQLGVYKFLPAGGKSQLVIRRRSFIAGISLLGKQNDFHLIPVFRGANLLQTILRVFFSHCYS